MTTATTTSFEPSAGGDSRRSHLLYSFFVAGFLFTVLCWETILDNILSTTTPSGRLPLAAIDRLNPLKGRHSHTSSPYGSLLTAVLGISEESQGTEQEQHPEVEEEKIWEYSRYDSLPGALPLCRSSDDLIQGQWEASKTSTALAACCGWDDYHWAMNTNVCGNTPMPWLHDGLLYQGQADSLAQSGGHGCTCPASRSTDMWRWRPSNCSLLPWDADRFCELLGNRTMLFIGDSTMGQSASMMMNAVSPGGCQAQIYFGASDTLIGDNLGVFNRGLKWLELISMIKPNITVLSAGAHIATNADFTRVLESVVEGIEDMRVKSPGMKFIWKTQQPGRCSNELSQHIPQSKEEWLAQQYRGELYNYPDFLPRDAEAKRLFRSHNVSIIDLHMMYHRTDAHPGSGEEGDANDCLHFCMPGPLDLLPILVYHTLLEHPDLID